MKKPSAPHIGGCRPLRASTIAACAFLACLFAGDLLVDAGTIVGSKHDLSTSLAPDDQVCAFCHTPHVANDTVPGAPLWNRFVDLGKSYTLYGSSTLDTTPTAPNSSVSIACLGCHDGNLATTTFNSYSGQDKHTLINAPGPGGIPDTASNPNCVRCHGPLWGLPEPMWLGLDLSDDHPVSMLYPTPAQDPAFMTPPDPMEGWPDMVLYDGKVECPTCHTVHDPDIEPFLRKEPGDGAFCLTCHVK